MLETIIGRIAGGEDLSAEEMGSTIELIMQGQCQEQEIGLFLTGLRMKGEATSEIAGAAAALRRFMTPIRSTRPGLLDTCGTGGDGLGTFNISTAAALVAAAAGVSVAKHGNRSASGRTGSAEVLRELGVNIEATLPVVEASLDALGICFCFAPLYHGSMRHVAEVRRKLGFPTIFNFLGPLANPAGAPYQLVGVGMGDFRRAVAEALAMLGTRRAAVVHGEDGLDEVSIGGPTLVTRVGGVPEDMVWTPATFGLAQGELAPLLVAGPTESAALIRRVLAGEPGAPRDIVVANAAAALWVAEQESDLSTAAARAVEAIDRGAARDLLARLGEFTHRLAS
ncbi:MAG: anthranilate phosphoribosyltransferase [Pirellulales bacterium]|nr:anthranilate phosphoribosyltransferase [Pirellulales bacterium]